MLHGIYLTGTWNLRYINNYTILTIIMPYPGFCINVFKKIMITSLHYILTLL